MGKFNVTDKRRTPTAPAGPIATQTVSTGVTHEGAPGYARDAKGELFLLAVSNMVGEDTFYEKAGDRDARFEQLVHTVAVADPAWTAAFLGWLRSEGNMRSASLVGALEAAKAMLGANIPGARAIVASVLQRPDEPGEAIAYWIGRYGRAIPKPVKRGIADAAARLYTEYGLLKYDTVSHGVRFADVLDLVHPTASTPEQGRLYTYALDRRHGRGGEITGLPMVDAQMLLREEAGRNVEVLMDTERLRLAGMTWEDALSLAGNRVLSKAVLWEALIPTMGYMALIRNLRNFDEAGVSDAVAQKLADRIADPDQVARSRQFPFRFLAAYEQAPSLRWGHALDRALQASLRNLPALPGRSLILIDTSASMTSQRMSAKSTMTAAKAAAVFGVALGAKGENVDLYGFAEGVFRNDVPKGASVIREVDRFVKRTGEVGHGTEIARAVRSTFSGHDRVFIISDMQTMDGQWGRGVSEAVPSTVPIYGFNLSGYQHGAIRGGVNRHEFGGLTDATFRIVPLLEAGRDGTWPWITDSVS